MNINITKNQIYERKADNQGRISLPTKKYAGKKLEIIISDELED